MDNTLQDSYSSAIGRTTLWASLLFAVILGFSRLSYGLFLPGIQREMGGSYVALGIMGTVNFIGYMAGTLCLPLLITRFPFGKRVLNRISCLLLGLAMIGSAFSHSFIQLGLWRFAIGALSAFATVLVLSIALDAIHPAQRGIASGFIWSGGCAGIVVTGLLAPYTIDPLHLTGWRLAWIAMGAFGVLSSFGFEAAVRGDRAATMALNEAFATPSQERVRVTSLLFSPKQLLFLMCSYFFFGWGYIIYFTYLIPYLANRGIPSLYAGLIWSAIGFAGLFNGWIGGKAIDRWPNGYTLATGLALGTMGALGAATDNVLLTSLGGMIIGLVSFITPPLMTTSLIRRKVSSDIYAACLSIATACFAFGQIVGPLFGGWAVDRFGLQAGVTSSAAFIGFSATLACMYGIIQQRLEKQKSSAKGTISK